MPRLLAGLFTVSEHLNLTKPANYVFKVNEPGYIHYSWSADLSKNFSQLIASIFTFLSQWLFVNIYLFWIFFFNRFLQWKSVGLTHISFSSYLSRLSSCFLQSFRSSHWGRGEIFDKNLWRILFFPKVAGYKAATLRK